TWRQQMKDVCSRLSLLNPDRLPNLEKALNSRLSDFGYRWHDALQMAPYFRLHSPSWAPDARCVRSPLFVTVITMPVLQFPREEVFHARPLRPRCSRQLCHLSNP